MSTDETPFDIFVRQAAIHESFGSVDTKVLASVASALWTHPKPPPIASRRKRRKSAIETMEKIPPNHCTDCQNSLLQSKSLSLVSTIRTERKTRSQRRRSARQRKRTGDDTLCCKTLQIYTCGVCGATFQTPGVRNPRPQHTKHDKAATSRARLNPKDAKKVSKNENKRSIDTTSFPVRTTLDDGKKRKKKKKNPASNDLMDFLSSLND